MQPDKNEKRLDDDRRQYIPGAQEKTSLGGNYNTGVTSDDPEEKAEIEKKGSLAKLKPKPEERRGVEDNSSSLEH